MCIEYGVEVSPEELKNVEVINIIYFLDFLMLWEFILSFIVCDSIFQVFKALKGHWRFFDFVKKGILKDSFLTLNCHKSKKGLHRSLGRRGRFPEWGTLFPELGTKCPKGGFCFFLRGQLSLRVCFFATNERDIVSLKID